MFFPLMFIRRLRRSLSNWCPTTQKPPLGRACIVVIADEEFGDFYKLATYRGTFAGWHDEYGDRLHPYAWLDFERAPYLGPEDD